MTRCICFVLFAILSPYRSACQNVTELFPSVDLSSDTIVLLEQPDWKPDFPIFSYCSFFEELNDDPLDFNEVVNMPFVPYNDSLRQSRPTDRPTIKQWLRFTVRNQSADTLRFRLNVDAHYFVRLYDSEGFVARSGIYETTVAGFDKGYFSVELIPGEIRRLWVRTEDRRGQFAPSWISLETDSNFYKKTLEGVGRDRLLFLLLSLLTGTLIFISAFALWQYYLFRDAAFLWYVAYTTCAALTGFFWIDIRHQFGIFSSIFHDIIFSVFLFVVPVLYSVFIGQMLNLKEHFPRAWSVVRLLVLICLCQAVIEYTTTRSGVFIFNNYYGYFISMVPVAVLNIFLLILAALSTERVKWFMFGGLVSMFIFWCLPMLIVLNLEFRMTAIHMVLIFLPFYFLTGLTIEAICFSFAISFRSKLVWQEKNELQLRYSLTLEEELNRKTSELDAQRRVFEDQKISQLHTAFEKRIAETEMAALRAQMNPHFIFNCLNAIKLYTLGNDAKSASEYLTLFSQLIRMVLEHSRCMKVPLYKELETLRLYMALEAMRFKDKVSYEINVSQDIDLYVTEVPPLLIQPYVENAIWHGLMHKKEGGKISILITQSDEQFLLVEIIDDGIGREQAEHYRSKSAVTRKSFGLKVTEERIQVINQAYGMQADVKVADVKDAMDRVCGTKVVIRLPVD